MDSQSKSNRRAAIFDMDGLLLDTERVGLSVFQEVCAQFELGDLTELFMRLVGTNSALGGEIMRQSLQGIMDHRVFGSAWSERYADAINGNPIPVKEGAEELLLYLSENHVPCAVATSTHSELATNKLCRAGLMQHFQFIVGGEQVRNGKPDPEPYLTAAGRLRVSPTDCIALEDSENGVRSAVAAGMTVFQIPDLITPSESLLLLRHQVFPSLRKVLDHLQSTGWHSREH